MQLLLKILISALIIAGVSELGKRFTAEWFGVTGQMDHIIFF